MCGTKKGPFVGRRGVVFLHNKLWVPVVVVIVHVVVSSGSVHFGLWKFFFYSVQNLCTLVEIFGTCTFGICAFFVVVLHPLLVYVYTFILFHSTTAAVRTQGWDGQTDRRADGQTGRRTDGKTDRQTINPAWIPVEYYWEIM